MAALWRQSTECANGSELSVDLVGLAQQEQTDTGGGDHDHSTPHEAAQKVGERGGHGVEATAWV